MQFPLGRILVRITAREVDCTQRQSSHVGTVEVLSLGSTVPQTSGTDSVHPFEVLIFPSFPVFYIRMHAICAGGLRNE